MENSNQPTPNNEETVMSNIQAIFQAFVESGGEPKVTSFKRHLDKLINSEIKPLCGRSGKAADGTDWRSEVKAKFGGRGAKWVFVSIDSIRPTLSRFADQGIDIEDYTKFIADHGQAWVRFSGPRIDNGVKSAAFEVRTDGSTIDHPKQLHYVPVSELDETITFMNSTPHAMKVEEEAKPQEAEEAQEVEIEASPVEETAVVEEDYVDAMDQIDELMEMEDMDF